MASNSVDQLQDGRNQFNAVDMYGNPTVSMMELGTTGANVVGVPMNVNTRVESEPEISSGYQAKPRPVNDNPDFTTTQGYLLPGQTSGSDSTPWQVDSDIFSNDPHREENADGYIEDYEGYTTNQPLNLHHVDDYGNNTITQLDASSPLNPSVGGTPIAGYRTNDITDYPEDLDQMGSAQKGQPLPSKTPQDLDIEGMEQPHTEDENVRDTDSVYSHSSSGSEPTFGYMNEFGQLVYITDPEQQQQLAHLAAEQGGDTQVMYIDEAQYKQLRNMRS
eukprot:CFRG4161T1